MRTCTGCRAVTAQADLVRVAVEDNRLVLDPRRRIAGRGAYVHPRESCVTVPGLARALRRSVTPGDVQRLVAAVRQMSRTDDNFPTQPGDPRSKNPSGLGGADAVETPGLARIKAEDDRSEDARL